MKIWRIINLLAAAALIAIYVFEMRAQFFSPIHRGSHLFLVNASWVIVIASNLIWRVVQQKNIKVSSKAEVEAHGR